MTENVWVRVREITTPRNVMEPPRVFVSYRWESEAHIAWVTKLVREVQARDVVVYLDRDIEPILNTNPRAGRFEKVFSHIAKAHVFMPILTSGYLTGIGEGEKHGDGSFSDGWVYDEWQISLGLQEGRQQEAIPILREGDIDALPFGWHRANTLDLRDENFWTERLDRLAQYLHHDRAIALAASPFESPKPWWKFW